MESDRRDGGGSVQRRPSQLSLQQATESEEVQASRQGEVTVLQQQDSGGGGGQSERIHPLLGRGADEAGDEIPSNGPAPIAMSGGPVDLHGVLLNETPLVSRGDIGLFTETSEPAVGCCVLGAVAFEKGTVTPAGVGFCPDLDDGGTKTSADPCNSLTDNFQLSNGDPAGAG